MRKYTIILNIVFFLMVLPIHGFGADVTLKWSSNSEADLAGYYVYYKEDNCCSPYLGSDADQGDSPIKVPIGEFADPNNPEYTLTGLQPNRAYYLVVTAYNANDEESDFSNEVKIKAPQITTQPIVTYLSNNASTIEWFTNEPGDSEVRYGPNTDEWNSYPNSEKISENVRSHSITLTGLSSETRYHFRGGSTNELGYGPDLEDDDANPSDDNFFITASPEEADTRAPQFLILPYVSSTTEISATIKWETDETANSVVEYGQSISYGQSEARFNNYTTNHSIDIDGLESDTLYHVRVTSTDISGNSLVSSDFTFRTNAIPDITAPIFTSAPAATVITDDSVTIEWETNEASSTKVQYGTESAIWRSYPSRLYVIEPRVLDHQLTITGLSPDTRYYFRAASKDNSGNQVVSDEFSFKTALEPDTTPPRITGVPTVISKTDNTATIVWDTDEPASSTVRYWEESWPQSREWQNYQFTKGNIDLKSQHSVTLTNLKRLTRYYFLVGSSDAEGNGPTIGLESNFVTEDAPDLDPPQIILPPTVTAKTNKTVTIEWVTDEPSNSIVQYGESSSQWNMYPQSYFNPEGVTDHRVVLAGLDENTVYYARVGGTDAFNNGPDDDAEDSNPSAEIIILTEPSPDSDAPEITAPPTVTAKSDIAAVIEWSTDEPSSSIVQYGTESGEWGTYPGIETNPDMVTEHFIILTSLIANQQYYFRVGSADEHGNGPEISHELYFTTEEFADTASPRIVVPPTTTGITDTTVTIEWETDEPSNSEVKYVVTPESGGEPDLVWTDTSLSVVSSNSMVTRHVVTLTNLEPSQRYFFSVGSTDVAGNGPDPEDIDSNNPFSKDFFYTEMERDDKAPKIISGPTVTAKDNQSAIIEWETDEPSNSIVRYDNVERTWFELTYGIPDTGLEECFIDNEDVEVCYPVDEEGNRLDDNTGRSENDSELVTLHRVTISGLQPTTTYYYRVGSTDALGNGPDFNQDITNPSQLGEFITEEGPDEFAPFISNLRVFFVTNTTALITWETDEPSNSLINYGVISDEWDDYMFSEGDAGLVTYHSITITGLQPGTQYFFRAGSVDFSGNGPWLNAREGNPSNEMTFTSATGPDVTAPQISNVRIRTANNQTAIVEWVTDEPSNSQVRYDTSSQKWLDYAYGESDIEMVTEHSVTLTGLSPSTRYYIRVSSMDASGNNYETSFNDKNPSIEYNLTTSEEDPPSVVQYPDAEYPKVDSDNNTIEITYDEPNMQNVRVEANYFFEPDLVFADPGNSIREIQTSANFSAYRLSFVSVPAYTVITMTLGEEITDADGYKVEPATILINDNDEDGLPDDWEEWRGLDPESNDPEAGQGSDGDFDGDGSSNFAEFINTTDPRDADDFPSPAVIVTSIPHDSAGLGEDDFRVPNNSSFAVYISDENNGLNVNDETSAEFTIDDGVNEPYLIDLGDTDVVRFVKVNSDDLDTAVTQLWIVYDRSKHQPYGLYAYDMVVDVAVRIKNLKGDFTDGFFTFKVESEESHNQATDEERVPNYTQMEESDNDFEDDTHTYNMGFQIANGDLPDFKIIFNDTDIQPEPAPIEDLPSFDVTDATAIGLPLNLEPPTIFNVPVKLIIPIPEDIRAGDVSIYVYNGEGWLLGCDTDGNSPDISGWMVPGSRVNGANRIQLKVYHFSGIQAALFGEGGGSSSGFTGDGDEPPEEVGSCWIDTLFPQKQPW